MRNNFGKKAGNTLLSILIAITLITISFSMTGLADPTGPTITNITRNPNVQTIQNHVNITCNVTGNADEVFINITYPDSTIVNESITANTIGDIYYYNTTYSITGEYVFFIWANNTEGQSTKSPLYTFTIVQWNVELDISVDEYHDTVIFGEVDDANDGPPADRYDVPKPTPPGNPYVSAWFDDGLSSPHTRLWHDYRSYPDTSKTWNLSIKHNTTSRSSVSITWDTDRINTSEYSKVELWNTTEKIADMRLEDSYTFAAEYDVSYNFYIECIYTYDLTVDSTTGGSVTDPGEATFTYDYGTVVDLVAAPDTGYHFVNWTGDVSQIFDVDDPETNITMLGNYVIMASFAINEYTISASAGVGGGIDPSGSVAVDFGDWVNFTITPDTGYHIVDVLVDGVSQGAVGWYNFTDVDDDHSIVAEFIPLYTNSLQSNWNLVSIPFNESVIKSDIIVSFDGTNYSWDEAVLSGIILDFIYSWNRTTNSYENVDMFEPGFGYWIWSYQDNVDLLIPGFDNDDEQITLLKQQWNIMGLPFDSSMAKEDIIVNYSGTNYTWSEAVSEEIILGFIYGWSRNSQQYELVDILQAGQGYWVYAFEECTLLNPNP